MARGTVNLDMSAMGLGNGLGNAEPQTGPSLAVRAGRVSAVEPLENLPLFCQGETNPCVSHPQRRPGATAVQGEGHTAAGWSVLNTIVHQIQQQPPQAFIIPLDGRRVQRPWLYGEALGSSQDPGLSHDLGHQLSQVADGAQSLIRQQVEMGVAIRSTSSRALCRWH